MSARELRFHFDFSSPFAYLAATQVQAVAKECDATLSYHPFLLGGLFASIGTPNVPLLEMSEAKRRYQAVDIDRFAGEYGVAFHFPTRFPMKTVTALRMTLQLIKQGAPETPLFVRRVFDAYWVEDKDINDATCLVALANDANLDGANLIEGCSSPTIKQALRDATEKAQAAGICGAPSFEVVIGTNAPLLFWGQDRIHFVKKALDGWRPKKE